MAGWRDYSYQDFLSYPKNYDVIFKIYNHETAGAAGNLVWGEQQTVTVDKGYFSVLLGDSSHRPTPPVETWARRYGDCKDKAWLLANKLDQDADFQKTWPFQRTPHVALTFGAVTLKYDAYSIAPYSYAHPELKIPYPRLNGIVKPNLFPGRG